MMFWDKVNNDIKLSNKKISWDMLNLLEVITWKSRWTIRVEFSKRKIKLNDYSDIDKYLKDFYLNK